MALNPADRVTVATGQSAGNQSQRQKKDPSIFVWNSEDMTTIVELNGMHQRGVNALAFSPSGNKLASVGMDDQNTVVVWDWKRGKSLGSQKSGGNAVFHINFDSANDNYFMTVAAKQSNFFTIAPGGKLTKKSAIFGRKFKAQTQFRTAPHRGGFITGSYNGKLYSC